MGKHTAAVVLGMLVRGGCSFCPVLGELPGKVLGGVCVGGRVCALTSEGFETHEGKLSCPEVWYHDTMLKWNVMLDLS